jgi:hypothetical protein
MKTQLILVTICILSLAATAQDQSRPTPNRATPPQAGTTGGYSSDLSVVTDSQQQAIDQAKEMLDRVENPRDRAALDIAIKEMERSQTALKAAAKSPDKLPGALAAEQAAYQALLKVTPREYRVSRQRNGNQNGAGQPNQRQLDQLEMNREENRYETERQASAAPNPQQREQLQTADRLKELAQRQQDLNERLRELQTALEAAQTDEQREELQRQLKRLRDEERQMLADLDELRQQVDRSPNANSMAEARQQLDQTRSDMQRAAQELDKQSASQALAAGSRAQQSMQNLREDLRRQTSSQFSDQMRQMRNQARDLSRQEEEVARKLDSLQNGEKKSLDDSADRKDLVQQMSRQQNQLTNLLSEMRAVTEQSETSEPLLSHQLYDTLRRADQMHTGNLLDMSSQLAERGFLPQASEAERSARQNIDELRQRVERAAESVLGNEAEALRYADKELEDLTRQIEREMEAAGGTNLAGAGANGTAGGQNATNRQPGSVEQAAGANPTGNSGTNGAASANSSGGTNEIQLAGNNRGGRQSGETGRDSRSQNQNGRNPGQPSSEGQPGDQQSGGQTGNQANNGNQSGQPQSAGNARSPGQQGQRSQRNGGQQSGGGQTATDGDRMRQWVQQLGGNNAGGDDRGGPITGGNFANWSDRLRDVERVLDPQDLRNQVATVRERAGALRAEYRQRGQLPRPGMLETQIVAPLSQVRVWLREELARQENANNLVPLDRDPVPENYSELVRKYYEKLGSAK